MVFHGEELVSYSLKSTLIHRKIEKSQNGNNYESMGNFHTQIVQIKCNFKHLKTPLFLYSTKSIFEHFLV